MNITIKGYQVQVDDDMAPLIISRRWHIADRKRGIYFSTTIRCPDGKYRDIKLHRFVMEVPPGMLVDHINGDHLDCRRQNLRVCTVAENTRNEPRIKSNTTGFRGVSRKRNGYRAQICYNRKNIFLGSYGTPEEAAAAYDRKARELFGDFYRGSKKGGEN